MSDMQGACRVGRHKFDLHFFAGTDSAQTKALAFTVYALDNVVLAIAINKKVDEARTCQFDIGNNVILGQGGNNFLG
jgi:hypothetical protein